MKLKFKNYEALFIYPDGHRTEMSCDFLNEAMERFKKNEATTLKVFKATHNNTRLKKFAEYGTAFK